jgi:hypothetical protein
VQLTHNRRAAPIDVWRAALVVHLIQFLDGSLSDVVNLTRAKDAALAFALQALNGKAQETPPDASYIGRKRSAVPNTWQTSKHSHEPRSGFLAANRETERQDQENDGVLNLTPGIPMAVDIKQVPMRRREPWKRR